MSLHLDSPILILDDDKEFCAEIADFLTRYHLPVRQAHAPSQADDILNSEPISMILLDVMLPEQHGFQYCRNIRERMADMPIMFVSAYCDTMEQVLGFEAGADDFLNKPFIPQELLARIKAVMRRSQPQPQAAAEPTVESVAGELRSEHGLRLDLAFGQAWLGDEKLRLTTFQFDLLAYFMRHPQRLITRAEILKEVHDYSPDAISRSVDINVSRIRKALGDNPEDPRFIRTVWRKGYYFVEKVT